jgi:colanic acid/amylovoran biosynthesis glycosyltransferase
VRGWDDVAVDPEDQAEQARTRYVLQRGLLGPLLSCVRVGIRSPRRLMGALGLALSMWRASERTLFHHLAYLAEAAEIVSWLGAEDVCHLHAHFGTNPAEVAMLVRALGGPPYSFTVHGPEEFDKPRSLGLATKGERAAFVVAISSFGRSQLYRWMAQSHWDKVEVVHCGIDRAFHQGAEQRPGQAASLVCVGRLCEQKGQLLLVEAMHALVAKGIELELVLAGDGEMRAEIEASIQRLALGNRVRITGWIGSDQVRAEILAAHALVLPSFAEGLPVVIMEAMALRRPVITTYVAGIPELVRDGESGWLVPAGDVDELARAMQACLSAPAETLERMGVAAHARVLARHDVDREAAKLAALFAASHARTGETAGALQRALP